LTHSVYVDLCWLLDDNSASSLSRRTLH